MSDNTDLAALREAAEAAQDAIGVLVERIEAQTMQDALRIDTDKLEALKIIALRERVRVNDLVLEGIDHVIASRRGLAA